MLKIYRNIDLFGIWLYMRVYKRPGLVRSIVRYCIPRRFKVLFIAKKNLYVFGFRNDSHVERFQLVHIVPPSVLRQKDRYLGSVKDVESKSEVFNEIYGNTYCKFVAPKGDMDLYYYIKFNSQSILRLPQNVVLYLDMPGSFLHSVELLRKLLPYSKIIYRAHNAEGVHNWEKFMASFHPKWIIKAYFTKRHDAGMLKHLDRIDVISKFDIDQYWSKIAIKNDHSKIRHLPFFYAPMIFSRYFSFQPIYHSGASKTMVCFGSIGKKNVLNNKGVNNLIDAYNRIVGSNKLVQFLVTGNYKGKQNFHEHTNIDFVGVLDDPNLLLARSDYLIDLSSIGYGFKTKFLDASLYGCRLVLDPTYLPRLPLDYYPFVTVLNRNGMLFDFSSHSREELRVYSSEINARNYSHARRLLNFDQLGVV